MLETLQNTASDKHNENSNYYRLAYQTARSNIDAPRLQFHSLVARLIGDNDHEKVLDIESKVAESYRQQFTPRRGNNHCAPYRRPQWQRNNRVDLSQVKCFDCGATIGLTVQIRNLWIKAKIQGLKRTNNEPF